MTTTSKKAPRHASARDKHTMNLKPGSLVDAHMIISFEPDCQADLRQR